MSTVNIENLNHGDVLAALYNASKAQGMGLMRFEPAPMTREEAEALLSEYTYFDYLKGRVMKVEIRGDAKEIDARLYDRDNGQGAAERAIARLRVKAA